MNILIHFNFFACHYKIWHAYNTFIILPSSRYYNNVVSIKTHTVGRIRVRAAKSTTMTTWVNVCTRVCVALSLTPRAPDNNPGENANYSVTMETVQIDIYEHVLRNVAFVLLLLLL